VVRDYELMYIVRPELDDEALRTATESVDTLIRGLGGTVAKTTMWGKRRLAYEVARLRDGHYVITLLQLDGARVANLERALPIHDTVFRHLLVRGDETVPAAKEGAEPESGDETLPAAEEGAEPESGDGVSVVEAGLPGDEDDAADDAAGDAAGEDDDAPPAEIAEGDEE
jgi:small subunit ribosomal protein S6